MDYKKVLLLIVHSYILILPFTSGQSLTPQWTFQLGGLSDDRGMKVAWDFHDNLYVAGIFNDQAFLSINGMTDTINSKGSEDIFFGKLSKAGQLLWSYNIGGKAADSPTDLMVDGFGNVFLSGLFQDSLFIAEDTLICSDFIDSFIAKFDSTGNVIWIRQLSGSGNQQCRSITSDFRGNLISAGFFSKSLEFTNTESPAYQSIGKYDAFIAKWTTQGNIEWINAIINSGNVIIKDVLPDGENNYYALGNFTDYLQVDSTQGQLFSRGGSDIFILKYDSAGNFQWSETFGSPFDDNAKCLTIGGNDKVVLVGEFKDTLIHRGKNILIAEGGDDIFYITINKNGKIQHTNQHGLQKNDFVFDAWIPVGQKILMASDLRINPGMHNTVLANYDLLGNMTDILLTGTDLNPTVLSTSMPSLNQIYYCGSFHGTVVFDQLSLSSNGNEDFFLLKLGLEEQSDNITSNDSNVLVINTPLNQKIFLSDANGQKPSEVNGYVVNNIFCNYPNPFKKETQIIYSIPESCDVLIKISDMKGNVLEEWQFSGQCSGDHSLYLDAEDLSMGMYECKLQAQGSTIFISKSIKMIHIK